MKWLDTTLVKKTAPFNPGQISPEELLRLGFHFPATRIIGMGMCPNCRSTAIESGACKSCGTVFAGKRFCDSVPVFKEVQKENLWMHGGKQLYKDKTDNLFIQVGTVPGCGRVIEEWCSSCRLFMPEPCERPSRASKKKAISGKDAAAGEGKDDQEVLL